jgi:hypothetical protein
MFGHVTRADLYKLVSKPVLARWMATYKVVFGVQRAIGMSARGRLICHSASSPRARRKAFWHIVVVCAARLWDLNIGRSKSFGGAGGHRRSHFGGLSIDYCPAVEKERIYSMMIVLKECNKDSTVIVETRLFKGWSGVAKTKDRRQDRETEANADQAASFPTLDRGPSASYTKRDVRRSDPVRNPGRHRPPGQAPARLPQIACRDTKMYAGAATQTGEWLWPFCP